MAHELSCSRESQKNNIEACGCRAKPFFMSAYLQIVNIKNTLHNARGCYLRYLIKFKPAPITEKRPGALPWIEPEKTKQNRKTASGVC